MELFPHQIEALDFVRNNERCILADEMGLGKTAVAAIYLKEHLPALITCPASLVENWKCELKKFAGISASIFPDISECTIINYEKLHKLTSLSWECVVSDEGHRLKNTKTRTYKSFSRLKYKRLLIMTATPVLNRPVELLPLLRLCGFRMPWEEYVRKYCNGHKKVVYTRGGGKRLVWDVSGASNLQELNKIVKPYMLRRRIKDIFPELDYTEEFIALPMSNKVMELSAAEVLELAKVIPNWESLPSERISMAASTIAKYRKQIGLSKVDAAVEYINEILEVGPVIVFAHHLDVISALAERTNGLTITGDTSPNERLNIVNKFQRGDGKVIICSILAAGVGLTMTAAKAVVFVEWDWRPAMIDQAIGRAVRIGQEDIVHVSHLFYATGLDAWMADKLRTKSSNIKTIMA